MEGNEMYRLAPSCNSPWDHQVEIENGKLILYRKKGSEEAVRTFLLEETSNLLSFLMLHKHEIDVECYKQQCRRTESRKP